MNNHRYTYMNRPTRTNQHYSADRSAFNPTHNSHSKPSVSKQAQGEKINDMATKIIQEVNRLHNTTQLRAITKEMLKEGGSKIFFDVFAILARALDEKIEREQLSLEVILSILKLFNYPGNLMKNMFQPIGAPHTWHHCLAILDFMAEIAHYALAFKAHCHQVTQSSRELQKDDNYLMIRAVFEENPKILSSKFEDQLHQLQFKIQNLNKEINQSQHIIRSLHLHQRPLQQVTNEITAEQKRLEAYQNDLISKKMEREFYIGEIDKLKRGLQKFQNKQIELNNQMASLEYRLAHKELTAEELAKLHEQVKDKKSQEKELQHRLVDSTNRIKRAYEAAITQLKLSYAKVNFATNQICSHPSNSHPLEIPFVDNFQQLSSLCDSLLTPEQPQECNISQELHAIASAWDLQSVSNKANAVLSQSRSRLTEKERQYYEVSLKCEQAKNQEYRMVTFADELKRRKNNQLQVISFQQSELQRLKGRLQRLKQANDQVSSEVLRLKQKRMSTEDEVTLLMDQIEAIRRESLQFREAMQARLKAADQSIEAAKTTMLTLLQKHRSDLGELLLKSKANQYINQILGKLKSRSEQCK